MGLEPKRYRQDGSLGPSDCFSLNPSHHRHPAWSLRIIIPISRMPRMSMKSIIATPINVEAPSNELSRRLAKPISPARMMYVPMPTIQTPIATPSMDMARSNFFTQSLSAFGTVSLPSSTLEDREIPFPISQIPSKVMTRPTQRTIGR